MAEAVILEFDGVGRDDYANTVGRATGAGADADAVRAQMEGGIATGRFSTPREVATLVVLLASPRTANVTGANWVIDGGMLKTT
jgi:NAD(P)-dependent dehydrogenase (short-subunit alcohol dehydrogenase family)